MTREQLLGFSSVYSDIVLNDEAAANARGYVGCAQAQWRRRDCMYVRRRNADGGRKGLVRDDEVRAQVKVGG